MGIEVAIASLVLTAVGVGGQINAAKKGAAAQEDAENAAAAADKQKRIEERRTDFRKRRIAAARIKQSSENTGVGGSSAESGALGSLATQGAATRGGINARVKAGEESAAARSDQRDANVDSSIFQGVTSIGTSLFSASGGFSNFKGAPAPTGGGNAGPAINAPESLDPKFFTS